MRRLILVLALLVPWAPGKADDYQEARRKLDLIQNETARSGSAITFHDRELNALLAREAKQLAAQGVRRPKFSLGNGSLDATAVVDFLKLKTARGGEPGWLLARLLEGERPVSVHARLTSSGGRAQVDVDRVEISGVPIEGRTLDYLIENYVLASFPAARVGKPFDLDHHVDRLELQPGALRVHIGRK